MPFPPTGKPTEPLEGLEAAAGLGGVGFGATTGLGGTGGLGGGVGGDGGLELLEGGPPSRTVPVLVEDPPTLAVPDDGAEAERPTKTVPGLCEKSIT